MRSWAYQQDRRWVLKGVAVWGTATPPADRLHIIPDGSSGRIDMVPRPPIPHYVTYCRSVPSGGLRIVQTIAGSEVATEDRICLHCLSMAVFWGTKIAEVKGGTMPVVKDDEPRGRKADADPERVERIKKAIALASKVQGIGIREFAQVLMERDAHTWVLLDGIVRQVDQNRETADLIKAAIEDGVIPDPEAGT